MTTQGQRADIEDIAALLDGSLEGEERARVMEALARDEESYALFEESAVAMAEERVQEEASSAPDNLVPLAGNTPGAESSSKSSTLRRFFPLAAAFVAAAVGLQFWLQSDKPTMVSSAKLLAALNPSPDTEFKMSTDRSGDGKAALFDAGHNSFLTAGWIERKDSERLSEALKQLAYALRSTALQPALVSEIEAAAERLDNGTITSRRLSRDLTRWERQLSQDEAFQLGRWNQAARIAAAEKNAAFFSSSAASVLWSQARGARPEDPEIRELVQDAFETIDSLMKDGPSDEINWTELEESLGRIYNAYHPEQS